MEGLVPVRDQPAKQVLSPSPSGIHSLHVDLISKLVSFADIALAVSAGQELAQGMSHGKDGD